MLYYDYNRKGINVNYLSPIGIIIVLKLSLAEAAPAAFHPVNIIICSAAPPIHPHHVDTHNRSHPANLHP